MGQDLPKTQLLRLTSIATASISANSDVFSVQNRGISERVAVHNFDDTDACLGIFVAIVQEGTKAAWPLEVVSAPVAL